MEDEHDASTLSTTARVSVWRSKSTLRPLDTARSERDRIIADIKLSKFRDGADRTLSRARSDASVVSPGISDERDSVDHQIEVERDMAASEIDPA
jgi:hypothetical protein